LNKNGPHSYDVTRVTQLRFNNGFFFSKAVFDDIFKTFQEIARTTINYDELIHKKLQEIADNANKQTRFGPNILMNLQHPE
jgi:hypothetical protein